MPVSGIWVNMYAHAPATGWSRSIVFGLELYATLFKVHSTRTIEEIICIHSNHLRISDTCIHVYTYIHVYIYCALDLKPLLFIAS